MTTALILASVTLAVFATLNVAGAVIDGFTGKAPYLALRILGWSAVAAVTLSIPFIVILRAIERLA